MAGRARAEWRGRLGYLAVALGAAALSLLALQLVLGRRLEQARMQQMGVELTGNLRLASLALERFGPGDLAEISGMRLAVGGLPDPAAVRLGSSDPLLRRQAVQLQRALCLRLSPCPGVQPAAVGGVRGVWIELVSPLERVWLFAPVPRLKAWPPDPLVFTIAVAIGSLAALLLFLALEVGRPLRQLEEALAQVGLERQPDPVPERGAEVVRGLTARFNAMLARLQGASAERATMLAGIAHDLRSPITRLRLRLGLASEGAGPAEGRISADERVRAEADLDALERITRQFLLFAGAGRSETAVELPLEALLAEASAASNAPGLELDLEPLQRRVRPTALARAVVNLLDNAVDHGAPPVRLQLRAEGPEGFRIAVHDGGPGIAADDWLRALEPFQRLDHARGGQGHSGLGLAIAQQVAREHAGGLERQQQGQGFSVVLYGRSLPPA
ncbi:MAG: ATP-binding protein [Synechococcaceae cyanobacterium]|nr:ATP-binding protein [Synechococcaceae cyanobacterium]